MQQEDTTKILDRIQKLLSLAADGSGATEAEMQSAMEQAHRLMIKHSLSIFDIEQRSHQKGQEVLFEVLPSGKGNSILLSHRIDLMTSISHYNFCKAVYFNNAPTRGQCKFVIAGRRENIDFVIYLYQYILQQMPTLLKRAYWELHRHLPEVKKSDFTKHFYIGLIKRIDERLHETFEEMTSTEENDCKALVVLAHDEVNAAVAARFEKIKYHPTKTLTVSADEYIVYQAGINAADNVNLSRPLNEGQSVLLNK